MIKNRLILIDAYALIFRAYHSIPPHFTDYLGRPTNAVYGFTSALLSAIKDLQPEYLAVGIDKGKSHRIKDYEQYKIHRPPAPDDFKIQVPIVLEVLEAMNIPVLGVEGYEGEDIIATIVAQLTANRPQTTEKKAVVGSRSSVVETIIVTGDMDLLQLIDGASSVYSMARGTQQAVLYDENKVKERYGISPQQFVDFKALKGDASDNIPGVPGIGEKTAIDLIQKFNSLKEMYDEIADCLESEGIISNFKFLISNQVQNPNFKLENNELNKNLELVIKNSSEDLEKIAKKLNISKKILFLLIANIEQAFLSQKLSKIVDDAPIEFNLSEARIHDYDRDKVAKLLKELGFKSLIFRLPLVMKSEDKQQSLF